MIFTSKEIRSVERTFIVQAANYIVRARKEGTYERNFGKHWIVAELRGGWSHALDGRDVLALACELAGIGEFSEVRCQITSGFACEVIRDITGWEWETYSADETETVSEVAMAA